jgi:hypothetical protein
MINNNDAIASNLKFLILKVCGIALQCDFQKKLYHCSNHANSECFNNKVRGVTRALIGGVHIHIFVFCPTNFF